ncbi:5'-nucleotidase C-terminal domain-containing protein [Paracoccus albus]|uniref:5'-nucleotidase C-terminal domain-containing protein n=1 Tax=Paracoccus albus TaxID=3017784 RepID=UPI0022F0A52A|nr:5'-nucleotidase C-terminal domain-containing protein [Paracoccus albus]WBU59172.1 5'-nucleotidase C-terminal domain-containing protein [Paracoccus albus]
MNDGNEKKDNACRALSGSAIQLRILATTDLHMNIGIGARRGGLARLAPVIEEQRRCFDNVLLFDNGDLIDGSSLGDELARSGLGPLEVHPAVSALNRLGYDAATLGNHDFAHGVDYLRRAMRDARFSLVLANAGLTEGPAFWSESTIIRRKMTKADGSEAEINVGVFGILPPQTAQWQPGLSQELLTEDIIAASRRAVSALRGRGAEVIVALSHGGIGDGLPKAAENAAGLIAEIDGVDAVIAGHTHEVVVRQATDIRAPIVKAGFGGTHLAAISLWIDGPPMGRHIARSEAEVVEAAQDEADQDLIDAILPSQTEKRLQIPIGSIGENLTSHFSLLGSDAGLRLFEKALRQHVAQHMPRSSHPVLVALAPFRTGGRGGPEHFVNIPAGLIRRGDISTLYPFTNHISVLEMSGAAILDWLERAASIFAHLPHPAGPEESRPLLDENIPGFNFDMIAGLEYEIDLSLPPAFDARGKRINPEGRVRRVRHNGKRVGVSDCYLLVTNSYRLSGTPLYRDLTANRRCILPDAARSRVRDIIARYITETPQHASQHGPFFRLTAPPGTEAWFDTSPDADLQACPFTVKHSEARENGFNRLTISL